MNAITPTIRPMIYSAVLSDTKPLFWVDDGRAFTFGYGFESRARFCAATFGAAGIWRYSRRRALVEALHNLGWTHCTLARENGAPVIRVQFSTVGDNLPALADIIAHGDQHALRELLERMDDFTLHPIGQWLSFSFPAHWAPGLLEIETPVCPECLGSGAADYSFLAIDPCSCRNTVAAQQISMAEWAPALALTPGAAHG